MKFHDVFCRQCYRKVLAESEDFSDDDYDNASDIAGESCCAGSFASDTKIASDGISLCEEDASKEYSKIDAASDPDFAFDEDISDVDGESFSCGCSLPICCGCKSLSCHPDKFTQDVDKFGRCSAGGCFHPCEYSRVRDDCERC